MPVDLRRILELAPLAVGVATPGPRSAAFLRGWLASQERLRRARLDEDLRQRQDEEARVRMTNTAEDNRRAQEALALSQQTAQQAGMQHFMTLGSTTDLSEQDLAGVAGTFGLMPDVAQTVIRPLIANRDKQFYRAALTRAEKDPLFAGIYGTPDFENLSVKNRQGDLITIRDLRTQLGEQLYTPQGQVASPRPADPEAKTAGSFDAQFADALTAAEAEAKRPLTRSEKTALRLRTRDAWEKVGHVPSPFSLLYGRTDPAAIAAQIRTGDLPPDLTQYGRVIAGGIATELAKPGEDGTPPFNLSAALRTWRAQVTLNRTMNSNQQVRLDQSIRSGLSMYDLIDDLADEWQGKGLGPLSRANLQLATEGVKGPVAQQIAVRLTGQIAQLTSDIAVIEQGGMTPTEEARKIAVKSLQDWWGRQTIHAMTAQGRANMRIRQLARETQVPLVRGNEPPTPVSPDAMAALAILEQRRKPRKP